MKLLLLILAIAVAMASDVLSPLARAQLRIPTIDLTTSQQISLVASVSLPGSFVTPQSVYADSERIYLCSFQGDLFVLERDRQSKFPLIQTISFGVPLAAVRGDEKKIYVSSRGGNLYTFNKSWPLQLASTVPLSNYGLAGIELAGQGVYVAKGQAAMAATENRIYLSALNPGDFVLEIGRMRTYGEAVFLAGATVVFDRQSFSSVGTLPSPNGSFMSISAWEEFVFLTSSGCCSSGVYVYDASSLRRIQVLNRPTNTIAGTRRRGIRLLVGGSEAGDVDLYAVGNSGYQLTDSINLPAATGFTGPEDIEIRALWVDGIDNLVFAASSGGNDRSRAVPGLPSFFVLDIRQPDSKSWYRFPVGTN